MHGCLRQPRQLMAVSFCKVQLLVNFGVGILWNTIWSCVFALGFFPAALVAVRSQEPGGPPRLSWEHEFEVSEGLLQAALPFRRWSG